VIDGPVTVPSPEQTDKATAYLSDNWAEAIG
jgi:putative spermidine/putrescine transport system substrate-binding protein